MPRPTPQITNPGFHLDLPTPWRAQVPVTLLSVALATLTLEPWTSGTCSSLQFKALFWAPRCPSSRTAWVRATIPNSEKIQGSGRQPPAKGQQQNQSHLRPADEEEKEAQHLGDCPLAHCRPSLPPSWPPRDWEHLAAGLTPGGVSSRGASFRQAPEGGRCCGAGTSISLQDWLCGRRGGSFPTPSPDIPA